MDHSETIRALAEIPEEGLFERLATSVLRQADPSLYAKLSHPGMNPAGKTRRSPVDGIGFVTSENPPRMVIAHHTTAGLEKLKSKWLNDPAKVKKRGLKPTAPAGDVIKTNEIVEKERKRTPNLTVTLALTSNRDPSEDLTRDVQAAANLYGITIDVWSGSRIAHYLDNTPDGQWLRRQYLDITQERISTELLAELSRRNLEASSPMPSSKSLIEREFDEIVAFKSPLPLAFYVGESGFGKTIACYRFLRKHVDSGGYGIVLSHETLSASPTLDLALDAELRKLHPSLEPLAGEKARSLCSPDKPLVVMVEDVNWAEHPALLLEKLIRWSSSEGNAVTRFHWRILCPVWPRTIATTSAEARKRIDVLSIPIPAFTDKESRAAVKQRAQLDRVKINDLSAGRLAEALGNDPLLIGLHDFSHKPQPLKVIETFVSNSLQRLSADSGSFVFTEYQEALRQVAREMLVRREIDPTWRDISEWFREEPVRLAAMREIIQAGGIVRLVVTDQQERLRFRHDRVRAWLLSEALSDLMQTNLVDDAIIAEPFFSDVIGSALASPNIPLQMVERVRKQNPLALFYALKIFGEPQTRVHELIMQEIFGFLEDEETHKRCSRSLRWAILDVLSDTESSHVIPISDRITDERWSRIRARFLNGDVAAGIRLCFRVNPGRNAPWRDSEIEHARHRFSSTLINQLSELLSKVKPDDKMRIGALRLAGHLAEPKLAKSIRKCWLNHKKRKQHLDEYLWAAAQCGGDNPAKLLRPICAAWAQLSNRRSNNGLSPREGVGFYELSWAFSEVLSTPATRYFVSRGRKRDLQVPIMWMLRGVNRPEAVAFIVRSSERHGHSVLDEEQEWERRQSELGKPMSEASREELLKMWKGRKNNKHIRRAAFRLWAATIAEHDLVILRQANDKQLSDTVLWARIRRGDGTAVPDLIHRLRGDHSAYWWQLGRYFWNEDLTGALEEELCRRGRTVLRQWDSNYQSDWIVSELLFRLNAERAEDLTERHWEHLRYSRLFIQAALLIATPTTCCLASEAVAACPDPASLFRSAQRNFYPQYKDGTGLSRLEQIESYLPYLDYLADHTMHTLWDSCNRLGWFTFRRLHLDKRLKETNRKHTILDEAKFFADLDDAVQRRDGTDWADFFIDRYLEQTDRVEDVLVLLEKWLKERMTIKAFDFVAAVIRHVGGRSNLDILQLEGIEPIDDAEEIRRDTFFAVARQSLN
jgi:hypothetical protein